MSKIIANGEQIFYIKHYSKLLKEAEELIEIFSQGISDKHKNSECFKGLKENCFYFSDILNSVKDGNSPAEAKEKWRNQKLKDEQLNDKCRGNF